VSAIVADHELAPEQQHFLQLNATLARQWPVINAAHEPLPDAEHWAGVTAKLDHLVQAA
jgi:ferredoxin